VPQNDEYTTEMRLDAEAQARAAALLAANVRDLFESYTDTHNYDDERRKSEHAGELREWMAM